MGMPQPREHPPAVMHVLDVPRANAAGVKLIRVDIDLDARLDNGYFSVLSKDEWIRATQFRRRQDGIRFAASRAALREILGEWLDIQPELLRFDRDIGGRPRIASTTYLDPNIVPDFNLSHSGGFALIALSDVRRVGVDLEVHDRQIDLRELTQVAFSPNELERVIGMPEHLQFSAFYDVWVAKEAFLKVNGAGIAFGMTHFYVLHEVDEIKAMPVARSLPIPESEHSDLLRLNAAWCPAPAGYSACLAWYK